MQLKWLGFEPVYYLDMPGDPGGGGADAGAGSVGGASDAPAEPTVYEVDDNTLIKPRGMDKPVKYGEHFRGLQSQFTKASQKAAELERALREREARIQQYERERQNAQRAGQTGQPDVYAALRELPYLDGETAVNVVRGIAQEIQQRDQVLLATLRQLKNLQQIVAGLNETHTSSAFDSKISRWLGDWGYDPGYADLAKEIYLAYEGDDLDEQFRSIFEDRVRQVEKLIEARKQAQIREARKSQFIPGKGGSATPSKPLELKADASAKEIADAMFPLLGETGT